MLEVVEVNSLHQLAGYRLAWAKLLAVTRAASFFQSLDWLEVYWRHFGGGQALRALVIKSDRREVLGILPFAVCRQRSLVGSLRALGYPFDSWGTFHGPIGPDPMLTLAAGLSYIAHTPRDWDLLDLRGIDLDHTDHGRTALAFEYAELPARRFACGRSSWIELDQGWDTYWHGRLCDFRTMVSTAEQELAEHGRAKYVRYRPLGRSHGDDDPRWDLYDACDVLPLTTIRREARYCRDLHAAAVRAGGLDLNLLYFNGRPAAFSYNVHYRGIVNILRMGFDGSIADRDALAVLIANMIRDGCQRRYTDRLWTAVVRTCRALDHENCDRLSLHSLSSVGGQISNAAWSAMVETRAVRTTAGLNAAHARPLHNATRLPGVGIEAHAQAFAARCPPRVLIAQRAGDKRTTE